MKHPEQKPDEIYLGNAMLADFMKVGWKTKRRGNIAYGSQKEILPTSYGLQPSFIKVSEVEYDELKCTFTIAGGKSHFYVVVGNIFTFDDVKE